MNNQPTDEELALICYSAPKGGHYLQDGHRALFTAGERRGIESVLDRLRISASSVSEPYALGLAEAVSLVESSLRSLESIRDAPAGELGRYLYCRTCNRCEGRPFAAGDLCPAHCGWRLVDLNDEPPAKPEAAGEEPGMLMNRPLFVVWSAGKGYRCYTEPDDARIDSEHYAPPAAVVTYVPKDRPAPAAKEKPPWDRELWTDEQILAERAREEVGMLRRQAEAVKEAGEPTAFLLDIADEWERGLKARENGDALAVRLVQRVKSWADCLELGGRVPPANTREAKLASDLEAMTGALIAASVGWSRKNDRLTNERDELKEERDRLRARVAELEADLSGTRAALADRTEELREERGKADGALNK